MDTKMSLNGKKGVLWETFDGSNGVFSGSKDIKVKKHENRASLVVQWLRVCLPMQGTRVRALVWEDPTCRGATRPVSHNY